MGERNLRFTKKMPTLGEKEISSCETIFFTREKKNKRVPVKKISGREKTEKSVRENVFLLVKKKTKMPKGFSRALFIFTGKKIHTRNFKIANNPQKLHVKFCEILV